MDVPAKLQRGFDLVQETRKELPLHDRMKQATHQIALGEMTKDVLPVLLNSHFVVHMTWEKAA